MSKNLYEKKICNLSNWVVVCFCSCYIDYMTNTQTQLEALVNALSMEDRREVFFDLYYKITWTEEVIAIVTQSVRELHDYDYPDGSCDCVVCGKG